MDDLRELRRTSREIRWASRMGAGIREVPVVERTAPTAVSRSVA
jgi:hypothetical protein